MKNSLFLISLPAASLSPHNTALEAAAFRLAGVMSGASGSHHSVPQALIYIAQPSRKNMESPLIFSLCILVDSCCVLLLFLEDVATSLPGDLFCFTVLQLQLWFELVDASGTPATQCQWFTQWNL